jgi:RHS repeat-associated protein
MNMTYNYPAAANNGQIASSYDATTGETVTYQYDALKRLLQANGSNWTENYVYDGYGNLTQMNPSGTANGMPSMHLTMAVDANNVPNNRVTGWADANGNQTAGFAGTSLIYDTANHVSQVQANGQNSYYWYDPDNRRIYYKNTSGAETIYFYGADGTKLATYTYAIVTNTMTGGNPEIQLTQQSTNVYFAGRLVTAEGKLVATDRLASVRSGGPGNLGYQAQFPYGVEYSTTANDREKYATYTRDSVSRLDYAVNRYYWSQWGRFLSPDPYADSAGLGDPGSWNRYAYTRNDPANRLDPAGLQDCQPCVILRPYPLPTPPVDDDSSGNGTGGWGGNSGDGCSEYNPFEKVSGTCIGEPAIRRGDRRLSNDCIAALRTAGQDPAAANRATAAEATLQAAVKGTDISWEMLAAVGVRESGFQNVVEKDGAGVGVGVFQITVSKASGVTAALAGSLAWAADYAAHLLNNDMAILQAKYPNLTPSQLLQAAAASYNFGTPNISGNPNTIDVGTAGGNYGSNILRLIKCFP